MLTMTNTATIDDYADSLFRFERLNPDWIDSCARYLRHVFGEAIEGKVFLDYAFGRGNWSLAALRAGARRVTAIDASEHNVSRFTEYCRTHHIDNIDIVCADILQEPINTQADIIWVYGILHHISDPDEFIHRCAALRRNDAALMLLYAYDRGSLRQVIVDAARSAHIYDSERSFGEDSYLYTPRARLRARDDLTAPVVTWYTAADLTELAARHGAHPIRQIPDFRHWLNKIRSEEFSPHHALCDFHGGTAKPLTEPQRPGAGDFAVLAGMAAVIMHHAGPERRRKLAVGLYNSHFSALPADGSIVTAVIEDFLFLMHAALRLEIPTSAFAGVIGSYHTAAMAAMVDSPRGFSAEELASSPLARFLNDNTVRF